MFMIKEYYILWKYFWVYGWVVIDKRIEILFKNEKKFIYYGVLNY